MQPALVSLGFVPGDSFDLTLNLFTSDSAGNRKPLQMSPGEVFAVTLGSIVASLSDAGPGRLQLLANDTRTTFFRQFTPAETRRFGSGCAPMPLTWSFARIPARNVRRTYAQGSIALVPPGQGGIGARVVNLTVNDGDVTFEAGVPDVASYTDAREAAIRQDVDVIADRLETEAFAAALLF